MKRKKIVVMGFMAGCPIAGVIWQHLHYLVGLQRLGHDVYYIEDSARLPYEPAAGEITNDYSYAAKTLKSLAAEFGFEDRWGFCARYRPEQDCVGLSKRRIIALYREADAILNVCGSQELNDDLLRSDRLLYVESDPGVEQIKVDKHESAAVTYLRAHRVLFTFGENIGSSEFPVPTHQFRWLPTRQPIVTDFWRTDAPPPTGAVFTSVANWNTSGQKDVEWRGETYLWNKRFEFLRFIDLPVACGELMELATTIDDPQVAAQLLTRHWRLADPLSLSLNVHDYQRYLQQSKGEFTVAKDQYVRLRTGWFSDRSACYLAAGRPVVTQDTGFTRHYGGERGLFAFTTLEEAAEAIRRINADYATHCRAAREIAAEHFEATNVLRSLLERAGV